MHDVFISYAHIDEGKEKWVTAFCADLTVRLAQRLGRHVSVWRDVDAGVAANDLLDRTIRTAVEGSRIYIAIISPAYVNREWPTRERKWFKAFGAGGLVVGNKLRLLRVRKTPLLDGQVEPAELRPANTLGVPFYEQDQSGAVTEYGPTDEGFKKAIDRVAHAAAETIVELDRVGAKKPWWLVGVLATLAVLAIGAIIALRDDSDQPVQTSRQPRTVFDGRRELVAGATRRRDDSRDDGPLRTDAGVSHHAKDGGATTTDSGADACKEPCARFAACAKGLAGQPERDALIKVSCDPMKGSCSCP